MRNGVLLTNGTNYGVFFGTNNQDEIHALKSDHNGVYYGGTITFDKRKCRVIGEVAECRCLRCNEWWPSNMFKRVTICPDCIEETR